MENYRNELTTQLKEIERLLEKAGSNLKKPLRDKDCCVKVSRSNGCYQYYISEHKGDAYKYVKSGDQKRAASVVQRAYDESVYGKLRVLKNRLQQFLCFYDMDVIDEVYTKLPEGKRQLVVPVRECREQLIERWMEEHPGDQNNYGEKGKILTENGELVRSKSEKIIADLLWKNRVPYQYEPRLELNGYHTICPDFAILNVRLNKTIYWEHFGLVSDPEYAVSNFGKIQEYEKAGYFIGEGFIFSVESTSEPINVKMIERKIRDYCL